jgi:hypothetical protein
MEEALDAWDALEEKYQGDGYQYLRKQSVSWANKLMGVRQKKFHLQQQKLIYGPGGIRSSSAAPAGAPVPEGGDEEEQAETAPPVEEEGAAP